MIQKNKENQNIAAIDIGTNSIHMIVASVNEEGGIEVLGREKESVRLGSGAKDMKFILPDAMERGFKALVKFSALAEAMNAQIFAVATSAIREALNKDEFINRVKKELNIDIEVVSGVEEARLEYIGVAHALPIYSKKTLVIDVGGGSVETIIGKRGSVGIAFSEKLGAIRLSNRFFPDASYSKKEVQECEKFIRGVWSPILKRVKEYGFDTVVGCAGTIQTLFGMSLAKKGSKVPDIMNGLRVSTSEILDIINDIVKARSPQKIAMLPGMDSARADIITAGALIVKVFLEYLEINSFTFSSYALREGILYNSISQNKNIQELHHLSNLRFQTIRHICKLYRVEPKHSQYVKNISVQIFDALQSLHKLTEFEREILEAASLLHDVGYHISHDGHHKHSYYIISNCIMPGFTMNESEMIANIARYHRKSLPKIKHLNFQVLNPRQQEIVKVLAGILRIAEGIDRRQMQYVSEISCVLKQNILTIYLKSISENIDIDIEFWGAERRKELLENSTKIKIKFEKMK